MTIWEEIAADANRGAERLVAEYGDRLYNSAVHICGNGTDAEDLVYRTLSQVVRRIESYTGRSSFYTWVYSVMMNFRKMDLRRKGANSLDFPGETPEEVDPSPDPAEAFVRSSETAAVRSAIAELDEIYRTVIVMFYFDDMEVAEIAQVLELPAGSVKSRLHRARKLLSRILLRTNFRENASNNKGRASLSETADGK